MTPLPPLLLWTGAVLLYGAGGWSRALDRVSIGIRRLVGFAGGALAVLGLFASVSTAASTGAAVGSALAHFTAAGTLVAVGVPLVARPLGAMAAVACLGGLVALLEAVS